MSRTLARQKLQAAVSALHCAKSNMEEAQRLLAGMGDWDSDLMNAGVNLMQAGCAEMAKALTEADMLLRHPVIDAEFEVIR